MDLKDACKKIRKMFPGDFASLNEEHNYHTALLAGETATQCEIFLFPKNFSGKMINLKCSTWAGVFRGIKSALKEAKHV